MEQFLSYFVYNYYVLIGLAVLFIIILIQVYYYLSYYNKVISYSDNKEEYSDKIPSVSVIIIAKNESENLAANLPLILSQDYKDFEVIVVNDGSTDESYSILDKLSKEDNKLYHTFSTLSDDLDSSRRRVLSMTIGIKAARNEVLLFTEAASKPMSNKWISSMMSSLESNKEIVIGYSLLEIKNTFWSKIAQFDNLIFSLQYLSMSIKNHPFIGVYRNIAYRKHLFFDNKGFSSTLSYDNAEEIFLNRIMTKDNTTISITKESFTSTKVENYSSWRNLKTIYLKAKSHLKHFTPKRFSVETASRYLLFIVAIYLITYCLIKNLWIYLTISVVLLILNQIIKITVLKKESKHFETSLNYLLYPILNLLQPIFNCYFLRSSKKNEKNINERNKLILF